jgi:effector-binding domain-containing protein
VLPASRRQNGAGHPSRGAPSPLDRRSRFAPLLHRGPYQECTTTYERLFAWIGEQGLGITGPIREIYHNDPREVKPEEILTEILAPVG